MIVWVVATVNLPGLSAGTAALVDVSKDQIARRISAGYLRVCNVDEADELDARAGRKGDSNA